MPAVEEEEKAGDGAVQAGKHVDSIAAGGHDLYVPPGDVSAAERRRELVGERVIRPGRRHQGISEKANSVDGKQANHKFLQQLQFATEIIDHAEEQIRKEQDITEA